MRYLSQGYGSQSQLYALPDKNKTIAFPDIHLEQVLPDEFAEWFDDVAHQSHLQTYIVGA